MLMLGYRVASLNVKRQWGRPVSNTTFRFAVQANQRDAHSRIRMGRELTLGIGLHRVLHHISLAPF